MKPVDILKAALAKIEDRKHWTQDAQARDKTGNAVHPDSPSAVCWCASGAVTAVVHVCDERMAARDALSAACALVAGHTMIVIANDGSKFGPVQAHKRILKIFRLAIKSLGG